MPTIFDILFRDHDRYTGDGQPNEPTNAPLPWGDAASGHFNIPKKNFRDALNWLLQSLQDLIAGHDAGNMQPYVVLAIGQSNMATWEEALDGDKSSDPNVFFWNCPGQGAIGTGNAWNVGAFGTAPLTVNSGGVYANSIALHCAKRIRENTSRPVYVIQIARGAHNIETFMPDATLTANGWSRGSGLNLYQMMANNIAPALALVPGSPGKIDAVIVHHGEANKDDAPELYARKLKLAFEGIEAMGYIDRTKTPIICGEIGATALTNVQTRHRNGLLRLRDAWGYDKWSGMRIVSSQGLRMATEGNVHFAGTSCVQFGRAYADAITTYQAEEQLSYEDTEYSVDGSLRWATIFDRINEPDYAGRLPQSLDFPQVVATTNGTLGDCYASPGGADTVVAHRMLRRIPANGLITIEYEVLALDSTGSAHRAFCWCYGPGRAFISSTPAVPPSSPALPAGGRIRVTRTFKRNGSSATADVTLPAGVEYFAPGVAIGNSASGAAVFNVLDIRVS